MAHPDSTHRCGGVVQLDVTDLGGEPPGVSARRGAGYSALLVAALSVDHRGNPGYLNLTFVIGFTLKAISPWAEPNLTPQTVIRRDDLACPAAVTDADRVCVPVVVGALKVLDLSQFMCINILLGDHKTPLGGAFHSLKHSEYTEHYLASLSYRFNRWLDLSLLVDRFIVDLAQCRPIKHEIVRARADARL